MLITNCWSASNDSEFYIPIAPGPRSRAILQRMIDGPTEEERVRTKQRDAKEEAERQARLETLRERHETLLQGQTLAPVTNLLEQHAPVEIVDVGKVYLECHGCPSYYDYDPFGDGSEQHHAWPCPTWQTISDSVGGENGDK